MSDAAASAAGASLDPNAPPPPSETPASGSTAPAGGSAPSQTSDYWGKGLLKEDGSLDHSRWEKSPEDIRDVGKDLSKYKTFDDLAKAWKAKNDLLGKKGIAEPLPKDATPEQRAEHLALVRKAVGAPDKPEGYVIERPKEVPEAAWDAAAVANAAKIAYEEGVSPAALQKLVAYETERQLGAQKAQTEAVEQMWAGQDKLVRELAAKEGLDYGKYLELAEQGAKRWAGVDKDNPLMKNATFVAAMARLGKQGKEAGLVKGDTTDDTLAQHTPETAQKALDTIRSDKTNPDWFAYWNRDPENPSKEKPHPKHDEIVAKAKRLSMIANANRPVRGR